LRRQRLEAGEQALLVCRNVDVDYDGVQVLFGVDFEVHEGEIVALLGTNGAGKSTLLRAISGVVHPRAGAIFFEGENISYYEPHETAAAGVVQVPGGRGIFPSLTVRENVETATWLYRGESDHVATSTKEVLDLFPILRERWDEKAGDLSGGEQQMLTLAQAFIAKPRLLMIDELTLGLAPILVEQLLEALKAIHARGSTVILVEQSVNLALTIAQRAYFMEKGEIRFSGPAEDLAGRTDLIRSVFLEGGSRAARKDGSSSKPKPVSDFTGAEAALQLTGVSKGFGGIQAVNDVSFTLRSGEILGIIGPNGAGKTTVFDLVSGFLEPDAGRIQLLGEDVTELSPDRRSRLGLGRSFQDARLFPSLTVSEAISVAFDRHLEVREPIAAALGLPAVRQAERKSDKQVEEIIEALGLGAFRDKFVAELSTGSRRVVDIACSLAHRPSVLILDEPSSGIAQAETEALGPLLMGVRDDLSCSLLVIEHDIPLVSQIADRLIALDLGSVVAEGEPAAVVRDPAVVLAYLGTSETAIARSGKTGPETDGASRRRKTKAVRSGSSGARKPIKQKSRKSPARAKPKRKSR
jgi:branched-chain amino acid transport system ATP-binding protein